MAHTQPDGRRFGALAPAALLLLALCLLASGAQAADPPRYVVGDILEIDFAGSGATIVIGSVDTTSLAEPYYHTFQVEQNGGRWEITRYWHGDLALPEHVLVEGEHAHRVAHVDPVKVIITDSTITGGFMLYYGLSLSEVRHGAMYPVEPEPGSVDSFPPSYVVGDILGNVSDPDRGSVVSSVYEQDGRAWFRVYFDAVRSGDLWILDKFYNDDMAFPASALGQTGMRRVAHADPHTVIINDTTTNTGEIGWYRLSLAEFLAGKSYDGMGPWHFNTGDILSNGTATRYIVGSATISYGAPSHYTLYEVVRNADGWEIPSWVNAGIPSGAGLAQIDGTGFDLVDHTDPHFAVVTDPAVENGVTFNGLSLGEILEGTPGYPPESPGPVGGDTGSFQVSTTPAGASIYLEDISGTRTLQGNTSAGPLNVTVYLTGTPVRAVVATLPGYRDAVYNVTQYPPKDGTLPVSLTLTPAGGATPYTAHAIPGRIEAEDYDLGGEGVAYHDTTPGNTGGAHRSDGVDIESSGGITNVGWVRSGEYLTYTVNVSRSGLYLISLRVATPNSGRSVEVSADGERPITYRLPNTGSFTTYATATLGSTPCPNTWMTVTQTPMPMATGIENQRIPIQLSGGTHVIKLAFHSDGQNLDWIEIAPEAPTTPTPTPMPYKPLAIPGTIQAEDYDLGGEGVAYHDTTTGNSGSAYRSDGVDIETIGATTAVGWIRNGEWLGYTVNVTQAGSYLVTARVASPNTERLFTLWVDGNQMVTLEVPDTGSFETFAPAIVPVNHEDGWYYPVPVTLKAGTHTLKLVFSGDGQNLDWVAFAPAPPITPSTPGPGGSTPFRPLAVPGRVEAEDYDDGGEGVAYHDTTTGNSGSAYRNEDVDLERAGGVTNVGWVRSGEWLQYTATVAQAGTYTMTTRVASPNSGRSIAVEVDGVPAGTVAVPNTGSFSTFREVGVPVSLPAGVHTLKLRFAGDGQNVDWFAIGCNCPAPPTTPVPSGGASFTAAPTSAPHGAAVTFTVTPAAGKTIASAWWSFDAAAHLNTWNSRAINPTFFYPAKGTFSPLVKLTYTDGSTETVQRTGSVTAT